MNRKKADSSYNNTQMEKNFCAHENSDSSLLLNIIKFSEYDSDETVVEDSIFGSDEEDDELHLKRLMCHKGVPLSSADSFNNKKAHQGNQSPEILHTCRLHSELQNMKKKSNMKLIPDTNYNTESSEVCKPTVTNTIYAESRDRYLSFTKNKVEKADPTSDKTCQLTKSYELSEVEKCITPPNSEGELNVNDLLKPLSACSSVRSLTLLSDTLDGQHYQSAFDASPESFHAFPDDFLVAINMQNTTVKSEPKLATEPVMHYNPRSAEIARFVEIDSDDDCTQISSLTFNQMNCEKQNKQMHNGKEFLLEEKYILDATIIGNNPITKNSGITLRTNVLDYDPYYIKINSPDEVFCDKVNSQGQHINVSTSLENVVIKTLSSVTMMEEKLPLFKEDHILDLPIMEDKQISNNMGNLGRTQTSDSDGDCTLKNRFSLEQEFFKSQTEELEEKKYSTFKKTVTSSYLSQTGHVRHVTHDDNTLGFSDICVGQKQEKELSQSLLNEGYIASCSFNELKNNKEITSITCHSSAVLEKAEQLSTKQSVCGGDYREKQTLIENTIKDLNVGGYETLKLEISKSAVSSTEEKSDNSVKAVRKSQRIAARKDIFRKTQRNIHKRNAMGETQLHLASKKGDLKMVQGLIKAGIDVNQTDNAGWTAIHEASYRGFTEIISELLQAGADVNIKGLDGILPIHDAAIRNHFKAAELLLKHGADPDDRDMNNQNAFDKSCDDRMTALLKSYSTAAESEVQENVFGTISLQPEAISSSYRYTTREKCGVHQSVLNTLQEVGNRQNKLMLMELQTSVDAENYVQEMRQIQNILNEIVVIQKNERDLLAKKYRASVDSFKQGILRDKISKLASRQKNLLQVVHNQKEVAQKIIAYQQTNRSDAISEDNCSSLLYCNTSPERNQASVLCSTSKRLSASLTNGSTIATKGTAVCGTPDFENNQFQNTFMTYISNQKIHSPQKNQSEALEFEKTSASNSNMTIKYKPVETENALLQLNSCSNVTSTDKDMNDGLEMMEPVDKCLCPSSKARGINVTDNDSITVNKINNQTSPGCSQISHPDQHSQTSNLDYVSQEKINGKKLVGAAIKCASNTRHNRQRATKQACSNEKPLSRTECQANKRQHISGGEEKKIRKYNLIEFIKKGILKPGENILNFKLQDYSHKGSLLPDGRIKDCSGLLYRDLTQWVKALLGNNISVTWKYVVDKVTYSGKELSHFIAQEDFVSKDFILPTLQKTTETPPKLSSPVQRSLLHFMHINEVLRISNKELLPCDRVDRYWNQYMEDDSVDA